MLQALRPEDALAIAEVSRRRGYDEQAMAQYLGVGRGARANGAPPDGTLLRLPGDVDLAAFESEERRSLEAAIAQLSPDARRELIALTWLVQRPLLSFEAALRRTRRIPTQLARIREWMFERARWHVRAAFQTWQRHRRYCHGRAGRPQTGARRSCLDGSRGARVTLVAQLGDLCDPDPTLARHCVQQIDRVAVLKYGWVAELVHLTVGGTAD